MTMHIADTLKALVTIIIPDILAALTEFVKNIKFLFKWQFVLKN